MIVDSIPLNADAYIKAIEDAIEAARNEDNPNYKPSLPPQQDH